MKKYIIAGFIVAVTVVGVLCWQHSKYHPSDNQVRNILPGSWRMVSVSGDEGNPKGTFTIDKNGGFKFQIVTNSIHVVWLSGTVRVEDGFLITTITSSKDRKIPVPCDSRVRIIQAGFNKMVGVVINGSPTVDKIVYQRVRNDV